MQTGSKTAEKEGKHMKKYMVITKIDGEQGAAFFDNRSDAERYRMDAECGCGGMAQVYEWKVGKYGGAYKLIYE